MKRIFLTAAAALTLLAFVPTVEAQQGAMSAPTLGYVYDAAARSVRPIAGVPGASSIEGALASASKLERVSISPNRRHAIGAASGGGLTHLRLQGVDALAAQMEGALESAELIAWSPASDAAAIYGSGRLQIWTGFESTPQLVRQSDVAELKALAISNGGAIVAGAGESGVLAWRSGAAEMLLGASGIGALLFTQDGMLIAAANRLLTFVRPGADPETMEGLETPSGLATSADSRKLLVTSDSAIMTLDLESRQSAVAECACRDSQPARLQGNAVFRLTGISNDQVLIYDGDSDEPRVLSIPFAGGQQ